MVDWNVCKTDPLDHWALISNLIDGMVLSNRKHFNNSNEEIYLIKWVDGSPFMLKLLSTADEFHRADS